MLGPPRGRPPTDLRQQELAKLQRENARLQADPAKARWVIEIQVKLSALLEQFAIGSTWWRVPRLASRERSTIGAIDTARLQRGQLESGTRSRGADRG